MEKNEGGVARMKGEVSERLGIGAMGTELTRRTTLRLPRGCHLLELGTRREFGVRLCLGRLRRLQILKLLETFGAHVHAVLVSPRLLQPLFVFNLFLPEVGAPAGAVNPAHGDVLVTASIGAGKLCVV